jgi:hypothetical protein
MRGNKSKIKYLHFLFGQRPTGAILRLHSSYSGCTGEEKILGYTFYNFLKAVSFSI